MLTIEQAQRLIRTLERDEVGQECPWTYEINVVSDEGEGQAEVYSYDSTDKFMGVVA